MSLHEHDSCVSEVSSTISRLRINNSQNSQNHNVEYSSSVTLDSESNASTPVNCGPGPYTIPTTNTESAQFQIPIIGYEVMEERARFTVYKLRIENRTFGDCWFVFRRYTDFVRLHSKLKRDFPSILLSLPRKRWFGDNFNSSFLEDRIRGLQTLINAILEHPQMHATQCVREFFCLDEPPSYADAMEESRPIFDALEETIYHLRCQLRDKEWELQQLQRGLPVLSLLKNSSKICSQCKPEVQKLLAGTDQEVKVQSTPGKSHTPLP